LLEFPVPALGIEIELPADASVRENTAQPGRSADVMALQSSLAIYIKQGEPNFDGNTPKDIAEAKARLLDTSFESQKPTELTKEEKTADGWHLEWKLPSSKYPQLGVSISKLVDGRRIDCLTLGASEKGHAAAVPACKSIRALAAK
jgi:hypothetical protein